MEDRFLRTGAIAPAAERRHLPRFVRVALRYLVFAVALVAVAVAATAAIALGVAAWRGYDYQRTLTLGFYLSGAILIGVPMLAGQTASEPLTYVGEGLDQSEQRLLHGAPVYVFVGLCLLGVALFVETR